jgi:hypothetical protein
MQRRLTFSYRLLGSTFQFHLQVPSSPRTTVTKYQSRCANLHKSDDLIYIYNRRTLPRKIDTLTKTGRKFVWGSHRPLHGVENVDSSSTNDETGFKVLKL